MFTRPHPSDAEAVAAAPSPQRFERFFFAVVALAALALLLLINRQLFQNYVFAAGDVTEQNLPMRSFYQHALQSGQGVLWMPQMFCGYYALAEGQGGFLHPLHYLLYRFLPLVVAFDLEALAPYVAMLIGAFWLLRREQFPRPAALFGAIAWTFCGLNLIHWGHINAIQVAAHLPFLLIATDTLLTAPTRRSLALSFLAISLLTTSQILMGHAFYFVLNMLVFVAWAGWRLLWPKSAPTASIVPLELRWQRAGLLVLAVALGVLFSAAQFQPSRDLVNNSGRQTTDVMYRMQYSMHPMNLVSLWSPFALHDQFFATKVAGAKVEVSPYNGLVGTLLIVWAVLRWRQWGRWRGLLWAAGIFGGVCLVISFGYFGFVYRVLCLIPPFNRFRAPGRYMELVHFAWAIFQTFSIADLLAIVSGAQPMPPLRSLKLLALPLALSLATALTIVLLEHRSSPDAFPRLVFASTGDAWLGVLLVTVVTLLVLGTARRSRVAFCLLMVFLVGDLFSHWSSIYPAPFFQPVGQYIAKVQAQLPPSKPGERIMSNEMNIAPLLLPDTTLSNGYAALFPIKQFPLQAMDGIPGVLPPGDPRSVRLSAAYWTRTVSPTDQHSFGPWRRVANPLPRARLVTQAVVSHDLGGDLKRYDPARVALLETPVALSGGAAGTANIVAEENGVVTIETDAPTRQLLVLADSYHLGWIAEQNGQPSKPLRAYGDYLAIPVEVGHQRTVFRFAPSSYRKGKLASFAGALLIALVCGLICLPLRKRGAGAGQETRTPVS